MGSSLSRARSLGPNNKVHLTICCPRYYLLVYPVSVAPGRNIYSLDASLSGKKKKTKLLQINICLLSALIPPMPFFVTAQLTINNSIQIIQLWKYVSLIKSSCFLANIFLFADQAETVHLFICIHIFSHPSPQMLGEEGCTPCFWRDTLNANTSSVHRNTAGQIQWTSSGRGRYAEKC